MLPGGHLTQLVLTGRLQDAVTLEELAALTSLRELRLPLAIPADEYLASVLTALTSLTALLLVNPVWEVQNSVPASVQELVVVQGWQESDEEEVFGLQLARLTNLCELTCISWTECIPLP
jgi:hypothetical protein